jgi:hypothetical protein
MATDSDQKSPVAHELQELERIADKGETSSTPLVLVATVWGVCAIALLVVLALAFLAYRLAS